MPESVLAWPDADELVSKAAAFVDHWPHQNLVERRHMRVDVAHPGGGTSTLLQRVRTALRERGMSPILITGTRDLDGSVAAYLDIAAETSFSDEVITNLRAPSTEKVAKLRKHVAALSRPVLLFDQPLRWQRGDDGDAGQSRDQLQAQFVNQLEIPIISGGPIDGIPTDAQHVARIELSMTWLQDSAPDVSPLRDSVASMVTQLGGEVLPVRGALARLATIAHAFGPTEVKGRIRRSLSRGLAATQIRELIEVTDTPRLRVLAEAWARLSLLRVPVNADEVDRILRELPGGPIDDAELTALRWGLMIDQPDGLLMMNEHIRVTAPRPRSVSDAHKSVARAFTARDPGARNVLRSGMEAWYHLIHTDVDPESEQIHAYFIEQLCLQGKAQSRRGFWHFVDNSWSMNDDARRCFVAAVAHFDGALKYEPHNAYALHYHGYNSDALGDANAESSYRDAISEQPDHVWWHSRLITHLLAKGAHTSAETAWEQALDACAMRADQLDEHLHRWVLRMALETANLTLARRVRATVQGHDLGQLQAEFDEMFERLHRYELGARDLDVLPLSVGLHALGREPLALRREDLQRWRNARVSVVEADLIVLRASQWLAFEYPGDAEVSTITMPREEFSRLFDATDESLTPGTFIELGEYRPNKLVIAPVVVPAAKPLRHLFPDPARFGEPAGT